MLSSSLFYVLYPKLAGKSIQESVTLVMTYFGPIIFINVILGGICIVFLPWLMVFVYGVEANSAVQALRILVIGTVIASANGLLKSFHAGIGKPQYNSYAVLSGIPFIIVGNLILTPLLGIEGAALSSVLAFSSSIFVNTYLFLYHNKKSFVDLLLNRETSLKKFSVSKI